MSIDTHPSGPVIADGSGGAVAAGHVIAAQAALDVLADGGNAIDAAIAASAVQCVVEPAWCGIGGDAFAMIHTPRVNTAINGSGAAPTGLNGIQPGAIPRFGALSVSVPGTVETWDGMATRFGTRPFPDLLNPAIELAEKGFPVDARLAAALGRLRPELDGYPGLARLLEANGAEVGETFYQPQLAKTLRTIAHEGAKAFYEGSLSDALVAGLRSRGGVITGHDLAGHWGDWLSPLSIEYRGRQILEHPPVSLGVILLQELRILEGFDPASLDHLGPELVDLMILCKQAAFSDSLAHLGDPHHESVPLDWMLSEDRAKWWRDEIRRSRPTSFSVSQDGPDTTSLAVVDGMGNTVTFIHSLFNEFGSREAPGDLGVILNDRLGNLVLEGGRPGGIRPGHRPVHTLNSFMVLENDHMIMAGATPGGRGQVQTLFQVLVRYLDHRFDIGEALRAPRWLHGSPRTRGVDGVLNLESTFPPSTAQALAANGYQVTTVANDDTDIFGSCTLVMSDPADHKLTAAADHRRGAAALAF